MGNDGGTIARGKDLKAIYTDSSGTEDQQHLQRSHNSKVVMCSLSSLPLYHNGPQAVVSDYKGKVYLKEKVLQFMLQRKAKVQERSSERTGGQKPEGQKPEGQTEGQESESQRRGEFCHLKRLSDLVELHVTWKDGMAVCSVSGTNTGLVYLRQCGCVVSQKMVLEVLAPRSNIRPSGGPSNTTRVSETNVRVCPSCGCDADATDVVYLNPPKGSGMDEFNAVTYAALAAEGLTHSKSLKSLKGRKRKRSDKYPQGEAKSRQKVEVIAPEPIA